MKKLMVLSLVLAMAGISSAGLLVGDKTEVMAGDVVNFQVISSTEASSISVRAITDSASVTGEMTPGEVYAGFTVNKKNGAGYVVNAGGILLDSRGANVDAIAGLGNPFLGGSKAPAGTAIYAFQYKVANGVQKGEIITINFEVGAVDSTKAIGSFDLTVVPEPMTMGLLGLGALFLRRRK